MSESTITADHRGAPVAAAGRLVARLVFIANTDDPAQPPSSHLLDGIDEVCFRRGERDAKRAGSVLVVSVPDNRMSSTHGCWRRRGADWLIDDPDSKNRTLVDGAIAGDAPLHDGAVVELGHSFFVFRRSAVDTMPALLVGDVEAKRLADRPHALRTFSPALARELDALIRVAASSISVLVLGETGTGKELVARAIHELSRRPGELVSVSCGELTAEMAAGELFGHKRGSYTGSVSDRRGLVRSADGGTLFLDEIGELPPATQSALLRVIQEREVKPIGEDRPVRVDLRLVSATLRDLDDAAARGRFRADLYARIAGHTIELPALRDRREDLGLMLGTLLAPRGVRLAPPALRAILRHDWPLNIRELDQALHRAAVLAIGGVVALDDLPASIRRPRRASAPLPPPHPEPTIALSDRDRALRDKLIALLHEHGGSVVAVAEALGKQRSQIYKWVKRLAIDLDAFRGA